LPNWRAATANKIPEYSNAEQEACGRMEVLFCLTLNRPARLSTRTNNNGGYHHRHHNHNHVVILSQAFFSPVFFLLQFFPLAVTQSATEIKPDIEGLVKQKQRHCLTSD
jgi:hypothetical protein